MFDDPSVKQLFFHAATKMAVLVALTFVWIAWVRRLLAPYLAVLKKTSGANDQANPAPQGQAPNGGLDRCGASFPVASLIGCLVLTMLFVYYVTFEPAYREVNKIDNTLIDRRDRDLAERDARADGIEVPPDGLPTLEDKQRRRLDQAHQDNTAGKQQFNDLAPIGP